MVKLFEILKKNDCKKEKSIYLKRKIKMKHQKRLISNCKLMTQKHITVCFIQSLHEN